jgi:hypothetical protein
MTTKQCVQAGMQFLDKHISNWTDAIDIDSLRLGSCKKCILGQLFENFSVGVKHLHVPFPPSNLGFCIKQGTFVNLTNAWKEALKKRKEERNG